MCCEENELKQSNDCNCVDVDDDDGPMLVDKDEYINFLNSKLKQMQQQVTYLEQMNASYIESIHQMQSK